MKTIRRARTIAVAWGLSLLVALMSASIVSADGGGTIFPR